MHLCTFVYDVCAKTSGQSLLLLLKGLVEFSKNVLKHVGNSVALDFLAVASFENGSVQVYDQGEPETLTSAVMARKGRMNDHRDLEIESMILDAVALLLETMAFQIKRPVRVLAEAAITSFSISGNHRLVHFTINFLYTKGRIWTYLRNVH